LGGEENYIEESSACKNLSKGGTGSWSEKKELDERRRRALIACWGKTGRPGILGGTIGGGGETREPRGEIEGGMKRGTDCVIL